jgi:hypothetical protein
LSPNMAVFPQAIDMTTSLYDLQLVIVLRNC